MFLANKGNWFELKAFALEKKENTYYFNTILVSIKRMQAL